MIRMKRGHLEFDGTRAEVLVDLAFIVHTLYAESKIPKHVILDYVNAGLTSSDELITADKIVEAFERMMG